MITPMTIEQRKHFNRLPMHVRDQANELFWPYPDDQDRKLTDKEYETYKCQLLAFASGWLASRGALVEPKKDDQRFRELPIDQRRKILADLRTELAELKQQDQAQPAVVADDAGESDDANELVDDGELAQLRALWGDK